MSTNPRYHNGSFRRRMRAKFKAMELPCHICGAPIHYNEPSNANFPLSFCIDEVKPVSRYREFGYASREEACMDVDNLKPAHWICNAAKSNKTVENRRNLRSNKANTTSRDW